MGPVLRTIMPERAKEIIKENQSRKLRILAFIRANPSAIHQGGIAKHISTSVARTAQREVKALTGAKSVKECADQLRLTPEGNAYLGRRNSGLQNVNIGRGQRGPFFGHFSS